jgi:hypothetical protein
MPNYNPDSTNRSTRYSNYKRDDLSLITTKHEMMKLDIQRNKKLGMVILVLLIQIYLVAGESEWIWYNGHDLRFEYPTTWGLIDGPTGVVLGDNQTFALSITMHKEGCYQLYQHPQLMDYMLKFWGKQMFGTPWGDPTTQFVETDIGPYSIGTQLYKNPSQGLICELQGYIAKNVTITFAECIWDQSDWGKTVLDIGRLRKSLNVTLSGNHTSLI